MQRTEDSATTDAGTAHGSFAKRFAALFALGMVGVVAVGVSTATGEGGVPGLPTVSGPVLATVMEPTTALVVRTVLLNAVAGVGFGWLYWRDSLEAAMVAHGTFYMVLVGLSAVLVIAT